jgi:hypothetical protein
MAMGAKSRSGIGRVVVGLAAATLAACGMPSRGSGGSEPVAVKRHVDGPAPASSGGGSEAPPAPLTQVECASLYDHVAELAVAESPAEEREETRAALEANRSDAIDGCQAGQVTRAQHRCFLAAKTWAELAKCDGTGE